MESQKRINPVITIHNSVIDIYNSITDIHNWLIIDILNCIMGSDNHILKLQQSFLNKMQIPAGYIFL